MQLAREKTNMDTEIIKPTPIHKEDMYKLDYVLNDIVLKQIEICDHIYLRIIKRGDEKYIDLNKFYSGRPTKKGIRFPIRFFKDVRKTLENLDV